MRLHHLSVTAFGPFPDTVELDFEELNDAGVFLVTGPTGAGKTSLLDAVCFALYGVVPGVRGVKTLRSDHAAPHVRPEVVLEVTIGDRRFRITRSPEWQRPKRRGEGTTKENARATLVELIGGTERLLSSRAQEVGHELGLLLGMSSEQFMQVVLLPQGEFQRFLRATSDQRQEVLQRLFGTQRFVEIEAWVQDRSRDLGQVAEHHGRRVAQLLATLAHQTGSALPDSLTQDPLGDVADLALAWSVEAVATVTAAATRAAEREDVAATELARAEEVAAEAARRTAAARRRTAAAARLAELDATQDDAQEAADRLARHRRAVPVQPFGEPLPGLRAAHAAATHAVATATAAALRDASVTGVIGPADGTGATADGSGWGSSCPEARRTRDALVDRLAEVRAAVPRGQAAAEAAAGLAASARRQATLDRELAAVEERAQRLPALLTDAAERLQALRASAAQLPAAEAEEAQAAAQHDAAIALPSAASRHALLTDRWRRARDAAADAREQHLALLQRRLAGIAAELAGQLVAGEPCAVCGGCEHPAPAAALVGAVTSDEQDQAEQAAAAAAEIAESLSRDVELSARQLGELEQRAGGSVEDATARLTAARARLDEARSAASELSRAAHELAQIEDESAGVAAHRAELHLTRAALVAESAAAEKRLADARADLDRVVGLRVEDAEDTLEALLALAEEQQQGVMLVDQLLVALEERDRLGERLLEATTRAEKAAAEQGFATLEEAVAALLCAAEATALAQAIQARNEERRGAEAVLVEEELRWLASIEQSGATAVDPADAADQVEAARAGLREATSSAGQCAQAANAARELARELEAEVARWEPARRRHATVQAVADLVRGRGVHNQLQMRLSSYVLATRLDQVLEAANARLCEMRDQRYTLRRSGATRGNARAGLGIDVLDAWTGEARTPATLSGGETFVVSLALALGLADVVSHEAGGLSVDTLFVDEGFGSLDPDTLDDVMDRLDALRAGGRTVGVVSHVTELRTRIPAQVHVTRDRRGSSVALRTLTS